MAGTVQSAGSAAVNGDRFPFTPHNLYVDVVLALTL